MQAGFLFFASILICLATLVFWSMSLRDTYNENKLLRQPQKVKQHIPSGRYQDETKIWQRYR